MGRRRRRIGRILKHHYRRQTVAQSAVRPANSILTTSIADDPAYCAPGDNNGGDRIVSTTDYIATFDLPEKDIKMDNEGSSDSPADVEGTIDSCVSTNANKQDSTAGQIYIDIDIDDFQKESDEEHTDYDDGVTLLMECYNGDEQNDFEAEDVKNEVSWSDDENCMEPTYQSAEISYDTTVDNDKTVRLAMADTPNGACVRENPVKLLRAISHQTIDRAHMVSNVPTAVAIDHSYVSNGDKDLCCDHSYSRGSYCPYNTPNGPNNVSARLLIIGPDNSVKYTEVVIDKDADKVGETAEVDIDNNLINEVNVNDVTSGLSDSQDELKTSDMLLSPYEHASVKEECITIWKEDILHSAANCFDVLCTYITCVYSDSYLIRKTTDSIQLIACYDGIVPAIKWSVIFKSDLTCDIHVHRIPVHKDHVIWQGLPQYYVEPYDACRLLSHLRNFIVCVGNPDEKFKSVMPISGNLMDNKDARIAAYVEGDFGAVNKIGKRYYSTIRTKGCALLVQRDRCSKCYTYRQGLWKRLGTFERRLKKIDEQKQEIDSLYREIRILKTNVRNLTEKCDKLEVIKPLKKRKKKSPNLKEKCESKVT